MGSIPEGSMLRQSGVGVRSKLGLKGRMLVWGDGWQAARRRLGTKVGASSLLGQPAFESSDADSEGVDDLVARHTTTHGCKDALT
jgi:hypothetical protein